jgi:PAS domain S-box-containing protein
MIITSEELIEAMSDGFILIDADWRIHSMNRRARVMLRMIDGDPRDSVLWDLMPDDPATPTRRELERAFQQHIGVEFDVFYPKLYVWHEVRAVPTAHGMALLLRDITDRQWLLRREAEQAYMRSLFDDSPVAMSITRGPDHVFEFVNKFARQLLGGRQFEGRTFREAFPELLGQGFHELLNQVYTSGTPYHATEYPIRTTREDTGEVEEIYVTFSYQPLRGFDNQVSGILTLAIDVTAQVLAGQQSRRMVAEHQAILSQLPEGVIVTDVAGRIMYVNQAAADLHGVATLEIGPEDYAAAYHLLTLDGQPYPSERLPLARAVREHVAVETESWKIQHPDGMIITVEGSARPISAAGTPLGAVLTMRRKPEVEEQAGD